MHKITFAQAGIAGITHTADVPGDMYESWMDYARKRGLVIIVDKLVTV